MTIRGTGGPDDALFWRDEILQVMWWFKGEGFGTSVTAKQLAGFLGTEEAPLYEHLSRLVRDGLLQEAPGPAATLFAFTEQGAREGARRFADEFKGMIAQGHGDCGPDCPICQGESREGCVHCAEGDQPS